MLAVLQPIVDILHWILSFFNGFIHSYGWSIILLTLTVRIILIPLTLKQTKAMKDMQRIQPKLKELQVKYKGDRDKLAQEQMKLYKDHKVSPLGGCLPILLQMPVFFALFSLLRQPMFKGVSFGPLADLSKAASKFGLANLGKTLGQAWPYYVLIALIVLTTYVSQKQTTTDPQQAKMMAFMPVLIGLISWSLPAGVLLYWTVFNGTMILQQWIYEEYFDKQPKESVVEPKPKRPKKTK